MELRTPDTAFGSLVSHAGAITGSIPGIHVGKSVTLTGVCGDGNRLISVFVNVGLNHPNPEDLAQYINVTYDSTTIQIENPYHPDSEDDKAGNPDNDTSLYVIEQMNITTWGGSIPSTWFVEIEDIDDDDDVGILEQFEIVLNSYTDPTDEDSDDDGLNDSEEANLGKDGYITDPNVADIDSDGWSDGDEFINGTDPAVPDTDRDGVNDPYDIDPLHNLILQIKVTKLKSCNKYKDHKMKVNVTIDSTYIEGSSTLDFLSQEYKQDSDIEFYVSVDIDDSTPSAAQIQLTLKSYKAYKAGDETGDLLLDTDGGINHKILDSGAFGVTKGYVMGDAVDYGSVWYEIDTLSQDKVTTHLILSKDGYKTTTTEKGALRYVGEQRFYAVVMNIDNDHQEMVIVPESIFYDSELGDILLEENMSDDDKKDKFEDWGLEGLQFSSADENEVELSRYLKGVWAVDITTSQIDDVILHLTVNKTGETPYEDIEVQDQIWTIGLPSELLEMTPTIIPKLSPLSQLTIVEKEIAMIDEWVANTDNSFVSAAWGWVKKPVTKLVKVTQETINFAVTLGEAILSNDPAAAFQALEDYGNFVWDGIVSFAQSATEFYVKMNAIFFTLALCALKVWLEYISTIGELIVSGLTWFFNFVMGLIEQAIQMYIIPRLNPPDDFSNGLSMILERNLGESQSYYSGYGSLGEELWAYMQAGTFFNYLFWAVIAFEAVLLSVIILIKTLTAGSDTFLGVAVQKIMETLYSLVIITALSGIAVLTMSAIIEITLYRIVPPSDPWWSKVGEETNLAGIIMSLSVGLINAWINFGSWASFWDSDAPGLFAAFFAFVFWILAMNEEDKTMKFVWGIVATLFAAWGMLKTLLTFDLGDTLGNPLALVEELIATAAFIYCASDTAGYFMDLVS